MVPVAMCNLLAAGAVLVAAPLCQGVVANFAVFTFCVSSYYEEIRTICNFETAKVSGRNDTWKPGLHALLILGPHAHRGQGDAEWRPGELLTGAALEIGLPSFRIINRSYALYRSRILHV